MLGQPVKNPLVGLDMSAETATYVGVLEATLAAYAINEAKYRCLLELLTDETWDTTRIDIDGKMLQDIAVQSLVRKLGIDPVRAKTLVAQRWDNHNVSVVPTPKSEPLVKENASQDAIPAQAAGPATMKDRLADWQERTKAAAETGTNVP